jgi:TonB family protein
MKNSMLVFFFVLLAIVLMIAHHNSRSRLAEEREQAKAVGSPLVPAAAPSPSATSKPLPSPITQATKKPAVDFEKIAPRVQPAVALISVFGPSGKLLRTGAGMVVSADGKIMTTRSLLEGASHGVAKMPDGRIENISGILTDVAPDDLAVVKAETKNSVPFVVPSATANTEEGAYIAIIRSPVRKNTPAVIQSTVSKRRAEAGGEWLEITDSVPNDAIGAPAINERGEVIGLLTRNNGEPPVVVRSSVIMNSLLARVPADTSGKWFVQESPPAPSEGPRKVPLAQNPQANRSKLVYSPAPEYPSAARSSSGMAKGTGRFRLTFDADGHVKDIAILRSTQNGALDTAAIQALRRWKAAPGEEWTLNVPITFQ